LFLTRNFNRRAQRKPRAEARNLDFVIFAAIRTRNGWNPLFVALNSSTSFGKLVHRGDVFEIRTVNKSFSQNANGLCLLGVIFRSHLRRMRFLVNKLCISNHCRKCILRYDVRSSLKELRWTVAVNRLSPKISRIIPGNWGKAESGWLARPLLSRIARFGSGGRIHQFL